MANAEAGIKVTANAEEAKKAFQEVKEEFEKVSQGAEILSKLIEGDFSGALDKATSAAQLFGAATEAAFEPLAVLKFIQTVIDAGNALGDFIAKTYIYTDADKKADDELKETNKTLLEYANKLKDAHRVHELLNATSESAKDKLKLQFAIEDNGSAADVKKKIDDLNVEMAKLKKASQETTTQPIGADMGVALEAQTMEAVEAEEKYKKLGATLLILNSRYKLLSETEASATDQKDKHEAEEAETAAAAEERARAQAAAAYQQAQQKQMQSFQQGLQAKKDATDTFHAISKADEAAYWADIINLQKPVGENFRQAQHNYVEANKAAQLQSLHDETEAVRDKASLAKAGSQDRVNILSAELDKLKAESKQYTDDYKRLEKEREKAIQEEANAQAEAAKKAEKAQEEAAAKAAKLQDDIAKIQLAETQEHSKLVHDMAQADADFELKTGKITAEQHQQIVRNALAQEYQDQSQAIKDKMMLLIQEGKTETTEYANLHKQLIKIDDDYHKNSTKLTQQWILQQRQQYQQYFNQFNQQFNTALNGMINGTETASQAFGKMFQDMLQQLVQFVEAWIEKKVEMWIMDKLVDDGGSQDQVDNAAQANSAMALSDASLAAANAYAANAWNPAVALAAATVAYNAVLGMSVAAGVSGAAKFEKGGIVPQTGLILAHAGETILPASMSGTGTGLPSMATGGGANLHVHFNMSAVDGESAARFIQSQSRNIASVVYKELKKKGMNG